ncbi:MAG: hypothetical protein AAF667_08325 [Pseudomonadota bacterium]
MSQAETEHIAADGTHEAERSADKARAGLFPFGPMVVAAVLSVIWIALSTGFFLIEPDGAEDGRAPLAGIATAVAVIFPLVLIWFAAAAAQRAASLEAEADRLREALSSLRNTYLSLQQSQKMMVTPAGVASSAAPSEAFVAFASRQTAPDRPDPTSRSTAPAADQGKRAAADDQADLPFDAPSVEDAKPVSVDDFIAAMNFPRTADDEAGFAALRRALADPYVNRLIQASQDVLTLMSQDGIYMDDLSPDLARPEIWRRFAEGERGRAIAMLGGVRDRSSLALSAQRMRQDHIFRDAAHHFLRQFDRTFIAFEQTATDDEIMRLTNTRTARAFMLLGRVAGIFD